MLELTDSQLLGEILQKAGLISAPQIEVALIDKEYNQNLRLGEILSLRGWLEQQTADFFADEWQLFINNSEKYPLGYYFEKSGLLTKEQINSILEEQKHLWIKFGSVAVIKGLLQENTVNFFLNNLFPSASLESSFIGKKIVPQANITTASELQIDSDDIPWID